MAKEFYTERDIEDMASSGQRSLIVHDDVVLTDLAYEKARRLGVEIIQSEDAPPAAPVRPYLNKTRGSAGKQAPVSRAAIPKLEAIRARVKSAVRAKLGTQVSEELLDRIIDRVAAELGLH